MEAETDVRPAKKRRFFADPLPNGDHAQSPPRGATPPLLVDAPLPQLDSTPEAMPADAAELKDASSQVNGISAGGTAGVFDRGMFESIIGESVSTSTLEKLQTVAGGNLERGEICPRMMGSELILISMSSDKYVPGLFLAVSAACRCAHANSILISAGFFGYR